MEGGVAGLLTVRDALHWATRLLTAQGSSSPRLDAEVLLAHVLTLARSALPLHWSEPLAANRMQAFTALVRRRAVHEPVAYLTGSRAFYDLDLAVDGRVLIPRPESEHLVEAALAWLAQHPQAHWAADVGVGSGALTIAVARHAPALCVIASDISPAALAVTRENLRRYALLDRVLPVCVDMLSACAGPFDLVLANLPYVRHDEIATLEADVAAYEPHLALDGGPDGLTLIHRLIEQFPERLARPGLALCELDPRQAQAVAGQARALLPDATVSVIQDYSHRERVVRIEHPAQEPTP